MDDIRTTDNVPKQPNQLDGRRCEDILAYLLDKCREYREQIRPLRIPADAGKTSYNEYDETYNIFLEDLHQSLESYFENKGLL